MIKRLALAALVATLLSVVLMGQTLGVLSNLFGATDTNSNLMVRMEAGSGTIQSRGAIGSLFGKVDTNGNLYVTTDATVPASATRFLTGDGTAAAPAYSATASPNAGMYFIGAQPAFSAGGIGYVLVATDALQLKSTTALNWASGNINSATDTSMGRTAAGQIFAGTTTTKPVINGTLTTSTTSVCTIADLNETTLFTYTLPAGALNANGRGVKLTAWGTFAATANNKIMRGYFGAEANLPGVTAASNGVSWYLTYSVLRTGAATEIGVGQLTANGASTAVQTRTPTDNTANTIVLKVTGQNGVAAANDICFSGAIVETIN